MSALHNGTLGALAVKIDRGSLPGYPSLDATADAVAKQHGIRSAQHLDDTLRRFRDSHFHTLEPGEKHDLLRAIQRHTDPGFSTVAVAYPVLKAYINGRHELMGGGATEHAVDAALADSFIGTFDGEPVRDLEHGERHVVRPHPTNWQDSVRYDDDLNDSVLSGWTDVPSKKS